MLPDPINVVTPAPVAPPPAVGSGGSTRSRQPMWPEEWVNSWVPLQSWSELNGLSQPVELTGGEKPVFQIATPRGPLLVRVGDRKANFNGQDYGLGFALRLVDELPYVHWLDAKKTFQVLLGGGVTWSKEQRTIVIDPGHGGKDSGTTSTAGGKRLREKDYTLDWARRVQRLLVADGWNVILTRSTDTEISLAERVAIAQRNRADLFLSLHFNSATRNMGTSGMESFCLTPTGMPSNLVRGYRDDPSEVYPNNRFDEQNLQWAARIQRSLLRVTGAVDRGVLHARFMAVLRGQHRPAVLIEGGYLSHPEEGRKIASAEYRQILAEGVAAALKLEPSAHADGKNQERRISPAQ
jgi:N-acetylmuramoyl-L-alanine amidase